MPVAKGKNFNLNQCLKNDLEENEMQKTPHASVAKNLTYVQVCTNSDIVFIIIILGRYLSNFVMDHCKATK